MINRQVIEIKSTMSFYRDSFRRLSWLVIFIMGLSLLFVGLIFYQLLNEPPRKFYATTTSGELVELKPMDAPNYSSKPLVQ